MLEQNTETTVESTADSAQGPVCSSPPRRARFSLRFVKLLYPLLGGVIGWEIGRHAQGGTLYSGLVGIGVGVVLGCLWLGYMASCST